MANDPAAGAESIELGVSDMTCAACVRRVERAIHKVDGVDLARVNLATERAWVRYDPSRTDRAAIAQAITAAGYGVIDAERDVLAERQRQARADEGERLRRDLRIAAALGVPVVALSMITMAIPPLAHRFHHDGGELGFNLLLLLLATGVQFGPGLRFVTHGWRALRMGAPDMNTLVMLGTSAAYLWSTVVTLAPALVPPQARHLYFEASAAVVALVLLGKNWEFAARGRASDAIAALLRLRPDTARVLRDGTIVELPAEHVRAGDLVEVLPFERFVADGEIAEGISSVDRSMLTGEPLPVTAGPGDPVTAGTINLGNRVLARVTKAGDDTVLARIVRVVEAAQATRPPIQALADRVVAVFVPVVLAIASLTAIAWMLLGPAPQGPNALIHAVAVLVIACPCAMGLATPISILVGSGRAAQSGVLFRNAAAIERLARVDTIVLDKTGTLTEGRPRVLDAWLDESADPGRLRALVATAAAGSTHPLDRGIAVWANVPERERPPLDRLESVPGSGIVAHIGPHVLLLGSRRHLESRGIEVGPDEAYAIGTTRVWTALDGRLAAVFSIGDQVREHAPTAIATLRAAGLRILLLSGDTPEAASALARSLSIDEAIGGASPTDKADRVSALRQSGRRVAFVGDGINDAPALAAADIGIAMGSGTDIAIETGEVVVMHSDPQAIVRALGLARSTIANIRWNLVWAFGYNIVLIPVAAGALAGIDPRLSLSPMLAALAMSLSSVFVVTNALRLRRA